MPSKEEIGVPTAAEFVSRLAWGTCPGLYLSHGVVSKKGGVPAVTSTVAAVPSFTALSPPMGLDYFGVFNGVPAVAEYLKVRMESAVAEQIEHELRARTPPIHESCDGVPAWWKTIIHEAFRTVDLEVVGGGAAVEEAPLVGATALLALVLEKYIVLANSGVSRAVISRGGEAKQLATEHRPNRPDEKQHVENAGSHTVQSANTIDDVLPTSRTFGCSPYKPYISMEPEVVLEEREPQLDEFLILATDGLWDAVTPAAACSFVRQRLCTARITMPWEKKLDMSRGSPTILAGELADHAVRAGSQGNVGVVLVLFRKFWDDPSAASSSQHTCNK